MTFAAAKFRKFLPAAMFAMAVEFATDVPKESESLVIVPFTSMTAILLSALGLPLTNSVV